MRQARRERTHTAIHTAALALVAEKGLKETTTDEIAAEAQVSPRTLFNYFAVKEDAVMGLRAPELTEQILEKDAARQHLDFFERLTHLLLDIIVASVDGPTYTQVQDLISRYPELRYRMRLHNLECETTLQAFLLTVDWPAFRAAGRRGPFPFNTANTASAAGEEKASAAVHLATALLRHLDFVRGVPEEAERQQLVSEAVQTFRYLLRED